MLIISQLYRSRTQVKVQDILTNVLEVVSDELCQISIICLCMECVLHVHIQNTHGVSDSYSEGNGHGDSDYYYGEY